MSDLQYEQETVIQFNEEEDEASVWSASPSFQRKMQKLGVEPIKTAERERGAVSCWYKVPRRWVKVKPPIQRHLNEEQRKALAERLQAHRQGDRVPKPHSVWGQET